jgi:hypothetical protein
MILSKAHRFIFIKGVKVGGTSAEIALSTICGPDDIVTPITPIDELRRLELNAGARNYSENRAVELGYLEALQRTAISDLPKLPSPPPGYYKHMPLRDVFRRYGPAAMDYRVVCVERHPYAKIFSWANHMLNFEAYKAGGEMRCDWHELKSYLERAIDNRSILAVKNIDRYRRPDGLISAHIMRCNNLAAEVQQLISSLGIEFRSSFPHAKKGILADDLDPCDLLNKEQIKLINELFAEEFDTFHYEPLQ